MENNEALKLLERIAIALEKIPDSSSYGNDTNSNFLKESGLETEKFLGMQILRKIKR